MAKQPQNANHGSHDSSHGPAQHEDHNKNEAR